ncbi:MAG: ceramidase domain-containing protein [Gammaproteobacteria bacterium]|nr:ceramidase domain-containing protein [Gammaproteobacteria bacterium]
MIDLYCERLSPDFWAEPVNALTNAAFLVAAAFGWRLAGRLGQRDLQVSVLLAVLASIGIGSFLFHTFATRWAMLADLIPILVFQLFYLWLYTGTINGWGRALRMVSVASLLLALVLSTRLAAYANGSLIYLPALLTLVMLALHARVQARPGRALLLAASALFALALSLRTIDMLVCEQFATGAHFGWHLLNALVLYLVTSALLRVRQQGQPIAYR